jgi:AcrR family transcriptional regulator
MIMAISKRVSIDNANSLAEIITDNKFPLSLEMSPRYHRRMTEPTDTRARIVAVAASLLAAGGQDAVTTRAVAAAADVQAPTIYRLFGDKDGLLDAVAEHGFAAHLGSKRPDPAADPVADLRAGWDQHIAFGLANPALYALMYATPRAGLASPAHVAAEQVLRDRIHRVAAAGRLRVGEARATELMVAIGRGTLLTLLSMPESSRDLGLADAAREALMAAIITDAPAVETPGPAAAAIALRAALPEATALTESERSLLSDWLDRLTAR